MHEKQHQIDLVRKTSELSSGELLFLISCSEIVTKEDRTRYSRALVIHASDLPRGRGWSPHVWAILGGASALTLSLLEAADQVDSGDIWRKTRLNVSKDALWHEINHLIFQAEIELMSYAIEYFKDIKPKAQSKSIQPSYHPKRHPIDSRIDPKKSIASQFNLIRICDPDRFPAYFELHGQKYIIRLEKNNA